MYVLYGIWTWNEDVIGHFWNDFTCIFFKHRLDIQGTVRYNILANEILNQKKYIGILDILHTNLKAKGNALGRLRWI